MLIIDKNLKDLAISEKICEKLDLIEDYCIQIRLSNDYYIPKKVEAVIKYGINTDSLFDAYEYVDANERPITLNSGDRILACSYEKYSIPNNIFGLVQTKGSLARLFVQVTCCDGQIEPGFEGKITLEIVNLSPFTIELPALSKVAQLYLFQCSMKTSKPYNGKYSGQDFPSLPDFNGF